MVEKFHPKDANRCLFVHFGEVPSFLVEGNPFVTLSTTLEVGMNPRQFKERTSPLFGKLVGTPDFRRILLVIVASLVVGSAPRVRAEEAVREVSGSLVIVGGGSLPDVIRERFLDLAGGSKARLVVIPTASELADQAESRSFQFWKEQNVASVELLHTRDPERANEMDFVRPLTRATGVWMTGGDQSRLIAAYRGTAVEKALVDLLARGGVIGGTSAGAAVMSPVMITGGNPQARVGDGFRLLPCAVIDQHFHNRKRLDRLLSVLARYPHLFGLGIDEETAVVVTGRTGTVIGNANVRICMCPADQKEPAVEVLKAGDELDLIDLARKVVARTPPPVRPDPTMTPTVGVSLPAGK
jgi:cyanophycinase